MFRKLAPLWVTYVVLLVASALGPFLSLFSGLARGHWAFLFLLPFALGSVPLSFILGEVIQRRTRASARFAWRVGFLHTLVFWAVFLIGMFDFLIGTHEVLYFIVWLVPSALSGLFFVLGMHVMRVEQAHSDARYGVEVRRGDPWASFFDLTWETGGSEAPKGRGRRRGGSRRRQATTAPTARSAEREAARQGKAKQSQKGSRQDAANRS